MKNLTPIILIILSVAIFFFFIDPQYKDIKTLQTQIEENNRTIEISKRLIAQRAELEKKFQQISRMEKEELEKLLPDTVDNVRLIIDINNIADQSGIVIRDIEIKSQESEDANTRTNAPLNSSNVLFEEQDPIIQYVDTSKIGVISFSFSASAEYEVFLAFLEQLEQSKRIVDIRSIEIARGLDSTTETVFFDYRVTFDTYWLK